VIHDTGPTNRQTRHTLGHYNAVQRLLYTGVIASYRLAVRAGFAIGNPVQLGWLTDLFASSRWDPPHHLAR